MKRLSDLLHTIINGRPRRQTVQTGKNAGIAKVLLGKGPNHAGMAIVIDPTHLITCAHVVNAALGRPERSEDQPDGTVQVVFPMQGNPTASSAVVEKWRPPGETPQDDIAVLKLDGEAPEEVGAAMLADVTGMPTDGDELSILGLAAKQRLGNHVDARFKGPTSAAWVQLDGVGSREEFIVGGFSGGAVWDRQHSAMLGMVVARKVSEVQEVAYMIPTIELNDFWPELPVEDRPLPTTFARTWTAFSAIYSLLLLAHWGWDRGVQAFSVVTLAGDQQQLAAFWGMHIYAFLAPVILWMLIAFAKSFRLHPWINRVPSFGAVRAQPMPSSTWRTAAISLTAFVVLPLIAQVHFINQFLTKGDVYIYPDKFGYETNELRKMGETCFENSMHYCTLRKEAGRFS